ncbi:hypothetical protein, partial [Nitrosovibrio sp. Nv17]|uniref:hypothetical protein n=1 Tax=Nitrosovibrio sp. Nv17 TaxID=1855339 RepID=UPI00090916AE
MKTDTTGNMGMGHWIAVAFMLGFLASCAQTGGFEAHGVDLDRAAQHARTAADHDRLARQYRSSAEKLQAKVEEQRQLLSQYEEKSYIYGRRAQDLQSHTSALLHKYERAMEETIQQASY